MSGLRHFLRFREELGAMTYSMRQSTLEALGLGTVLEIFLKERLPARAEDLVEEVFGPPESRGAMVISGAEGIVGSGKLAQFGSRLERFGVRMVALDFPGAPTGIAKQYRALERAFGREASHRFMADVVRLNYDGTHLPPALKEFRPRFLLEAIPEILDLKRAHYELFKKSFPEIEIRSVTSGFPSSSLGVSIAHPAFPHAINKVFEVVEPKPSAVTRLFWALGLLPVPVGDYWSFVLDVLFCGLTLAGTRYSRFSNMPYWKIDKYIRRLLGPNPFRAHDVIGAAGATFLTWSCLSHLSKVYGSLFEPTPELTAKKDSGSTWYPPDHFRPVVDWHLDAAEEEELQIRILGPLIQATGLMIEENRAQPALMNIIGELCAQFRKGVLALIRSMGPDSAIRMVEAYHRLDPTAKGTSWHPDVFEQMSTPGFEQLYVNAEHDGNIGVVTLGRESYNRDVDEELNRAIDWLKAEGIERVILSGDFHLASQLIGADTAEFYPALDDAAVGERLSLSWTKTARRLNEEFQTSVGFIGGKRCLGGMLELMLHCHYLIAAEGAELGLPEVTLPVIPGMEGVHWPFRKAGRSKWPKLFELLLGGRSVKAGNALGWLVDFAGPLEKAIETAGRIVKGADHGIIRRPVETGPLKDIEIDLSGFPAAQSPSAEAARRAVANAIVASTSVPLAEALEVQARHAGGFMASRPCIEGRIGADRRRDMTV